MLRLREDGETLVVRFPKEQRDELIEGNPDVFSVTGHYRNYPAVLVNLHAVSAKLLGQMIEGVWRLQASPKVVAALGLGQPAGTKSMPGETKRRTGVSKRMAPIKPSN